MQFLAVYRADQIGEEELGASIRITFSLPHAETIAEADALYANDAELLERVLHDNLPGGTYDRLLGLMLARKATHFRVAHSE